MIGNEISNWQIKPTFQLLRFTQRIGTIKQKEICWLVNLSGDIIIAFKAKNQEYEHH